MARIIRTLEEVEAGFPNVNEHGEYYHRIIIQIWAEGW